MAENTWVTGVITTIKWSYNPTYNCIRGPPYTDHGGFSLTQSLTYADPNPMIGMTGKPSNQIYYQVLPSDLCGRFKWPFQGWKRDLHLGYQKVTWKKLVVELKIGAWKPKIGF